jgi:hypothetical protein
MRVNEVYTEDVSNTFLRNFSVRSPKKALFSTPSVPWTLAFSCIDRFSFMLPVFNRSVL